MMPQKCNKKLIDAIHSLRNDKKAYMLANFAFIEILILNFATSINPGCEHGFCSQSL